jgi:DNA gyrase subunit A
MTPMETSFGVIMLAIVGGRPKLLNLKEALTHFIGHRKEIVIRRTKFELAKARERAHILEGLVKALRSIDEVINIIKSSKNQPDAKQRLMKTFDFTDIQAQAILDMRLGRLTSLEMEKVIKEYEEVLALIERLSLILADESVLIDVIVDELNEIGEKFADERKTEIVTETKELTIEDLVAQEDMVVTASHNGYIKRTPLSLYRSQKRGGKGMSGMDMYEGDFVEKLFIAKTHDHILIFSDRGRTYGLRVHEIPQGVRTGRGRSVVNLVQMRPDEKIAAMAAVSDVGDDENLIMVTRGGMIKKIAASEFKNARQSGVTAIGLADTDSLVSVKVVEPKKEIIVASRNGFAIRFSEDEIRAMGRSAQGVKAINLVRDDTVVGIALVDKKKAVLTVTENGYGKRTKITEYSKIRRGGKGVIAMKTTPKTGKLVGVKTVSTDDELIMISDRGKFLRFSGKGISIQGRSTQGIKLMNLETGERLVGVAILDERETKSE